MGFGKSLPVTISLLPLQVSRSRGSRPDLVLSRALIIPILQIKKPRLRTHKTASLLFGDVSGRIILSGNLANNVNRSKKKKNKKKHIKDCWMSMPYPDLQTSVSFFV